jgi:outer membrane protein assembly factor BamB
MINLNSRTGIIVTLCVLTLGCFGGHSCAEDWPQWMGRGRDNRLSEPLAISSFASETLEPVWKVALAGGYAGPAVANGRVFVTDYVTGADVSVANFERQNFSGIERVFCLSEGTGKVLWKHEYPVNYTVSYPAGPRCTPTVDGDLVYVLGTEGDLLCFTVDTGTIVWSRNLPTDFGTKTALWGYASHPLVDGDKLICRRRGIAHGCVQQENGRRDLETRDLERARLRASNHH